VPRRSVLYTLVEATQVVFISFVFTHRRRLDMNCLAILNSRIHSSVFGAKSADRSVFFCSMVITLFRSSRFSSCLTNEITTVSTMTRAEGRPCNRDLNVHDSSIVNDRVSSSSALEWSQWISICFLGGGRQNQDLGEDEIRGSNDEDTQRSNHSDENYQDNDNNCKSRVDKVIDPVSDLFSCRSWSWWQRSTRRSTTWTW
jgi:hypothetical protein